MASKELMTEWNKHDLEGAIQPPLSEAEVDALSQKGITPETQLSYSNYRSMARSAFIACTHFRTQGSPTITADTVAAFIPNR
ncbi:MAG: hypothetical protein UY35_C0003G0008 [Candidatus Saccharibacteria bacterium GW2011_GWC2_48_9]|nr:MAG: hypothetical protein UY35_C0003G0008 [Candidatus Saccharibacteria bacterium GW2011_GWC2_48_9]HCH34163.1 hypothetical protein [Candidatus Saccharibacteria bacterium]